MPSSDKNYLFTHNIDWYACINGTWIYAVSRGGLLPSKVDNEYMLPALQGICANLPDIVDKEDIVINQKLIEIRYKRAIDFYEQRLGDNLENDLDIQEFLNEYKIEEFSKQFSELFVEKACKGFYSFIRVDIDDPSSNEYRLVAYPKVVLHHIYLKLFVNHSMRHLWTMNIKTILKTLHSEVRMILFHLHIHCNLQ